MRARDLVDATLDALIPPYMLWAETTLRAPLIRAAADPADAQRRTLEEILRANADTEFGREHGFSEIDGLAAYRARVPVRGYDDLAPYIARQAETGVPALTAEPPVYYARTSGTTGPFKDAPLTAAGLRQVKRAQKLLGVSLHRATGFFDGRILAIASPAVEGVTTRGAPYGSLSGGAHRSLTPVVARKFVLPPEAYAVADYDAKYRLYALAALAAPDVTGVATANPSSILRLLEVIARDGAELLDQIESAARAPADDELSRLARRIVARAGVEGGRLGRLRAVLAARGRLTARDVWPRLAAVATWTGGSCGVALERLAPQLPEQARIVEFGYGASEFMGTANVDAERNLCLPLINEHVYEFAPRADWEAGDARLLGVEELEIGREYYVIVTTRSGLYRYDVNDIVVAEAGVGGCVGLRFLQKGRGVASVTGEKLSEHQVIAAVTAALRARAAAADAFMLLADEQAAHYDLLVEAPAALALDALAADVDARLQGANMEYAEKRASARLGGVRALRLRPGAADAIKRAALARGVREGQYKPVVIDYLRNWEDRVAPLVVEGVDA